WLVIRDRLPNISTDEPPRSEKMPFRQVLRNGKLWLGAALLMLNNIFFYSWIGWSPALIIEKGADPGLGALIASVSIWAFVPSVFLVPRLSFRLGVRKPFLWVTSFVLAGVSLGAVFASVPVSWAIMALAGVFNGARFVTIMALPIELMPRAAIGAATGLLVSVGYTGGIIGPWVGGYLFDLTGGLDVTLYILCGVSAVTGLLALKMPETRAGN
ncbi:CynX/NimT family MFS transporter, partial [Chloroflexota bacterium]